MVLGWQSVVRSPEVCGGFHLVITGVVLVNGSEDKEIHFISIKMTSR